MVAVILAVPAFNALTFPLLLTVATLVLLDLYVTTLAACDGFTFVLSVNVFPGVNTFFLVLSDTLLTDFLARYTVMVCLAFLAVPFFPFTVILAVPVFLAFITPLLSIVATLFLLELKDKVFAFTANDSLSVFFLSSGITTLSSTAFFTIFFTVTLIFFVILLLKDDVTVIVALPAFTAFITPLDDIFTTPGALLLNATFFDAVLGVTPVTFTVFVLPLYMVTFDFTFSVMDFTLFPAAITVMSGVINDTKISARHNHADNNLFNFSFFILVLFSFPIE